jgi:zinc/manganese transport system substrate-binding protein
MVTVLDNKLRTVIIFELVSRIVLIAIAALLTAGCGMGRSSSRLQVVAAENVYGDIARQIGGPHVAVTSVLTNPDADPHLFEPGTTTGLAVARASVVIANGLGYDAFVDRLVRASPNRRRRLLVVAQVLGVHGHDANPHLWYDVPRLPLVAAAIAATFERADARHATAYRAGLRRFEASLHPLQREVATLRGTFAGDPVAYTEPVPGYLLVAAGLVNLAPTSFTRAIENGSEPAPAAVAEMLHLLAANRVRVLLYNDQTVSPVTVRMRAAAQAAGIPVVAVSETLPPGESFQRWQLAQARALGRALSR